MSEGWIAPLLEHGGRDVGVLRAVAERTRPSADRCAALVALAEAGDAGPAVAATWVLEHWLADGAPLPPALAPRVEALLEADLPAEARLHLLQALPRLPVPSGRRLARLEKALVRLAEADHTFVRAWAYNGLAWLAHHHESLAEAIEGRLAMAEMSEPASVRARLRRARAGRFTA